jgi:DNA-binding MarR family transcriptional regulator
MSQDSFQAGVSWSELASIVEVASQFHRTFPRRGLDGFTSSELQVVVTVGVWPGLTPSQVAECLHLERNSVSESLRKLGQAGLTESRTGEDKRSRTLYLSGRGQMFVAKFAESLALPPGDVQ